MRSLLAALVLSLAASADAALSTRAASFINGLQPPLNAAAVRVVSGDNVGGVTLESLAARQDAEAVRQFVSIRHFLRAIRADVKAPVPEDYDSESAYLTSAEKDYIGRRFLERLLPRPRA